MQDILLVSADRLFSRMLSLELKTMRRNVSVLPTLTPTHFEEILSQNACGLLILDLDVPGIQPERLLSPAAEQKIPVILFGYQDSDAMTPEKIRFYDSDISRYVFPRPFLMRQFLYCAKELLPTRAQEEPVSAEKHEMKMKQHCAADDLHINESAHTIHYKNDLIPLTKTEYELLLLLMHQRGTVLSREELLERLRGTGGLSKEKESNVIDVYVRFLRRKIDDPYRVRLIETVRGVGYVIRKE